MEACNAVEREVEKVLTKFGAINDHADTTLRDLINHIELLKKELEEGTCLLFYLDCAINYDHYFLQSINLFNNKKTTLKFTLTQVEKILYVTI